MSIDYVIHRLLQNFQQSTVNAQNENKVIRIRKVPQVAKKDEGFLR